MRSHREIRVVPSRQSRNVASSVSILRVQLNRAREFDRPELRGFLSLFARYNRKSFVHHNFRAARARCIVPLQLPLINDRTRAIREKLSTFLSDIMQKFIPANCHCLTASTPSTRLAGPVLTEFSDTEVSGATPGFVVPRLRGETTC